MVSFFAFVENSLLAGIFAFTLINGFKRDEPLSDAEIIVLDMHIANHAIMMQNKVHFVIRFLFFGKLREEGKLNIVSWLF